MKFREIKFRQKFFPRKFLPLRYKQLPYFLEKAPWALLKKLIWKGGAFSREALFRGGRFLKDSKFLVHSKIIFW